MKITIQDIAPGEEEEIIVRCRDLDDALLRMIRVEGEARKIYGYGK